MTTKWTDKLNSETYNRLCNCTTIKSDLPALVSAKYADYQAKGKTEYTKEDALINILELLDCNGRYFDLTAEEYNDLIN